MHILYIHTLFFSIFVIINAMLHLVIKNEAFWLFLVFQIHTFFFRQADFEDIYY